MKRRFNLSRDETFAMDDSSNNKKGYVELKKTTIGMTLFIFLSCLVGVGLLARNVGDSNIANKENTADQEPVAKPLVDVRLPQSVIPTFYDLKFIPFIVPDNFTFNGDAKITLKVKATTRKITLHSLELDIQDANILLYRLENGKEVQQITKRKHEFVKEKEFLVIEFTDDLLEGTEYVLKIKYIGILNDNMRGFYRSSYKVENETRWIAATQFQATDARRAFPCFDEPGIKAPFKISIARPDNMISISNMPRESEIVESNELEKIDEYTWDVYEKSVPMSTYLVAFVVCDFVSKQDGNFSVWARAAAIDQANYALDIGPKILQKFEEFFEVEFPLPKMDMIALPDFSAGAMENWGLITYRETAMLFEKGVSPTRYKQWVANVVSHELSHQWFGNLVTPSWWTDLWLNEGFATYVAYLGVDHVEPTWNYYNEFILSELQIAFMLDALSSSHPILVEVRDPNEISEIFDQISYKKGASIIRMMEHFLTTRVFKQGLSNYLKERSFQSAMQDDLWEALTKEAQKTGILEGRNTVKQIMDTWTLQTGFPLVTVTRNYENSEVNFKQEKFYRIANNSTDNTLWWIPLTYTTESSLNFNMTKPKQWLRNTRELTIKEAAKNSEWIIVNLQQTGYYRVNYDTQNWKMLIKTLNDPEHFTVIPISNRAQLIDDAMNLAKSGYLDYSTALSLISYSVHETDYVPWKALFSSVAYLNSMMSREADFEYFKKFLFHQIEPIYSKIKFNDAGTDDFLSVYSMSDFVEYACYFQEKRCVQTSIEKFHEWMNMTDPDSNSLDIPANFKGTFYCNAIKYGFELDWNFLYQRYLKASVSSDKEILLSSLSCSKEPWILNRLLERSISDKFGIKKQNVAKIFSTVAGNSIGKPVAFDFIRNNWQKIKDYIKVQSVQNSILKVVLSNMNTKHQLEEIRNFIKTNEIKESREIKQIYESVEANIEWMSRNYGNIIEWLKETTISYK